MERKIVPRIMLTLLLFSGLLMLVFDFQPVKASATIYIRADGSVDPPEAPISTDDNITYTFTADVYELIVVERHSIIVDGAGHRSGRIELSDGHDIYSENVTMQNMRIIGGIYLGRSWGNTILANNITDCEYGICSEGMTGGGSHNVISGNNITATNTGIYLYGSRYNLIHNNIITGSNFGIKGYDYCNNNTIFLNNITANTYYGISFVFDCHSNNITQNNIEENGIGIYLDHGRNHIIKGNNIRANNDYGIWLLVRDSTVSGNNITGNMRGIFAEEGVAGSSGNNIFANNIMANSYGIYLSKCPEYVALRIYGNYITNNGKGIYLDSASGNNISDNTIRNNEVGFELHATVPWLESSNNEVYHNSVIDNNFQVIIDETAIGNVNLWGNGYPSGGNYWSDDSSDDLFSGPFQNLSGSDGIGDTPYVINEYNQDYYPLMKPYGGPHDIGITNVTTSKTVVGQGYNLNITIKIINYGINTEIFNLTTYADTTPIRTITNVVLASRNSTPITFTWDTADLPYGYYTISAHATPVPGETDTADNTYTYGTVLVTVPGDVNGDRTVDILDAGVISGHWYAGPPVGPLGYGGNADVNNDGEVDIFDAAIVSAHWLESW